MTGTIIRILHVKGFGFLLDEEGAERFIHVADLLDETAWATLRGGIRVEFKPIHRPNGSGNQLGVADLRVTE